MKAFMDKDFLLSTETARDLFHNYAAKMPVVDYHCHINPQEIAQDRRFTSITDIWLGGDHYKWRVMRACGVNERYITGDAGSWEKFEQWAKTLPQCIGNPLYHWTHLELRRYFGYNGILNGDTARVVYDLCNARLAEADMSVRGIIKQSNVKVICTTDDPLDDLRWHTVIRDDDSFDVKVQPAFRPDKAFNIDKPGFAEYIGQLGVLCGGAIGTMAELYKALEARIDYFHEQNCRVSDHALDYCIYNPECEAGLDAILKEALSGSAVTVEETEKFKTAVMLFLGRQYHKRGWVMQIHFGCVRNVNTRMFEKLGPDTGYDSMGNSRGAKELAAFLNALEYEGSLPKTILYSLNPYDNEVIESVMSTFQKDVPGKLQHGSAWWFNDTKTGMIKQMTDLANLGVLGNFVGMLTDSRSFLSYTRHEYFRRILCELIGGWVENGEYPDDKEALGRMVQDISYNNAVRYFGF